MSDLPLLREGTSLHIQLGKKLTLTDVPDLQSILKSQIEDGVREIVFDLTATTSIDSSALGLLIATHNSLGPLGGKVRMIEVPTEIYEMLVNMRLNQRLNALSAG